MAPPRQLARRYWHQSFFLPNKVKTFVIQMDSHSRGGILFLTWSMAWGAFPFPGSALGHKWRRSPRIYSTSDGNSQCRSARGGNDGYFYFNAGIARCRSCIDIDIVFWLVDLSARWREGWRILFAWSFYQVQSGLGWWDGFSKGGLEMVMHSGADYLYMCNYLAKGVIVIEDLWKGSGSKGSSHGGVEWRRGSS